MQCFQAIPQPTPPTKSNFVKRLESSQMTPLGEATSDKESLQMHCMSWDCCLYWSQSTDMSLFQLLVPEVQLPHWTNMLLKLFVVKKPSWTTQRWLSMLSIVASCILTLKPTFAQNDLSKPSAACCIKRHGTRVYGHILPWDHGSGCCQKLGLSDSWRSWI